MFAKLISSSVIVASASGIGSFSIDAHNQQVSLKLTRGMVGSQILAKQFYNGSNYDLGLMNTAVIASKTIVPADWSIEGDTIKVNDVVVDFVGLTSTTFEEKITGMNDQMCESVLMSSSSSSWAAVKVAGTAGNFTLASWPIKQITAQAVCAGQTTVEFISV